MIHSSKFNGPCQGFIVPYINYVPLKWSFKTLKDNEPLSCLVIFLGKRDFVRHMLGNKGLGFIFFSSHFLAGLDMGNVCECMCV